MIVTTTTTLCYMIYLIWNLSRFPIKEEWYLIIKKTECFNNIDGESLDAK